jgi:hypothetical protein
VTDLEARRARRWWLTKRKIASIERAGSFIDDVGFALLFPNKGVVIPTLYEASSDRPLDALASDWGPDADRVWRWKDELPARRLAWYGKYVRGRPSFLAPDLLADLYPRAGTPDDFEGAELSPTASRVARILLRSGPQPTAAIREALDVEGRKANDAFNRVLLELGRALVITHFGVEDEGTGWPSPVLELTARAFRLGPRPSRDDARLRAARRFVDTMLVVRAHELGNAFGWGAEVARVTLEELVRREQAIRDDGTYGRIG